MSDMRTPPLSRQRAGDEDPFGGSGRAQATDGTPSGIAVSSRKRTGLDAGISEDSPFHPRRRSLTAAQVHADALERKLSAAERTAEDRERVIAEQTERIERMMRERRELLRGKEEAERREAERDEELAEMRSTHALTLQDATRNRSQTTSELEALRTEHAQLRAAHVKAVSEHTNHSTALNARIAALERERDELRPYREQAHELDADRERLMRELLELREKRAAASAVMGTPNARGVMGGAPQEQGTPNDVLRSELRRQATQLGALQSENVKLKAECKELRARKDSVEMLRNELKNVERKSKEKIRNLNEELDRARREMDSLTQNFVTAAHDLSDDATTTGDIASLQHKFSTLAAAHANCASTIAAQKNQVGDLLAQIEQLSEDSQGEIVRLQKRVEIAEREHRWASKAKDVAESKLLLARQDIDGLRLKLSTSTASGGSGGADTGDLEIQIAQLEDTLEVYRQTIEKFQAEERDAQAKVILDLDLVKRADLDQALRKARSLEDVIGDLKENIAALESQNRDLDQEVGDLMIRVGSGEYNTRQWRCLELKGGPAEKDRVIRTETLDRLKRENEALLKQAKETGGNAGSAAAPVGESASSMVPRETYDRLLKESEEANSANAKRLQRLKEIFGQKSREFLDSVYSLLGWRIRYDPDKGDVALTSMYAPKGKMGLTLRFTSSEGHFGTMLMTGGMARGLEDTRKYWVETRQSVPGFLSQVTLEIFEKTTIGRAPGFVAAGEAADEDER